MIENNIILIGFTSTGKSTTGKLLGRALSMNFIDIDEVVESLHVKDKGYKRQCREIVSLYGRECFVRYENRALRSLQGEEWKVIATGGGTPIDAENRKLVKELGVVVYLKSSADIVFQRMESKGYPIYLGAHPSITSVNEVWSARHRIYSEIADCIIDNGRLSPEETAHAIVDQLSAHGNFRTRIEASAHL